MDELTTGLILRTHPLTETSLIVHWLTSDVGRVATVAKGARRPKSPFRGKLDLFYLCDFNFVRSRRSDLHILREVSLCETHEALRQEVSRLQQAAYCAGLIEQVTETETPLPTMYELMRDLLASLQNQAPQAQVVFAFELKLLNELGLKPDLTKSKLTPGAKQIVNALSCNPWPAVARLKLSHAQAAELSQFLHGFLRFHFGRIPKGRTVAASYRLPKITKPSSPSSANSTAM